MRIKVGDPNRVYLYPFEVLPRETQELIIQTASDPETGFERLLVIAQSRPGEVLANPTFQAGIAAAPNLVDDVTGEFSPGISALVGHADAPLWLIERALASERLAVVLSALNNPAIPQRLLEKVAREYAGGESDDVREANRLYGHVLDTRVLDRDDILFEALALLPFESARDIVLQGSNWKAVQQLLIRPDISFAAAHALLDGAPQLQEEYLDPLLDPDEPCAGTYEAQLARRPDAPEVFLLEIASRIGPVRSNYLTRNPACTPAVVEALFAQQGAFHSLWNVVTCPVTPAHVLRTIAADPDLGYREYVAAHPNTPPDTLAALSDAAEAYIVAQVAGNANTPEAIVKRLLLHATPLVAAMAAKHPRVVWNELPNSPAHLAGAALNPNSSAEQQLAALEALAQEANWLEQIAASREVSATVHGVLLSHGNSKVRVAAFKNSRTNSDQLRHALSDNDPLVRRIIAAHNNTPGDVLYQLLDEEDESVTHVANENFRRRDVRDRTQTEDFSPVQRTRHAL